MDKNLAAPYVTLARMEAAEGRTSQAMEHAQTAIKLNPTGNGADEAFAAMADAYQAQGRTADAIATLQKAIDLKPEDSRWQVKMGNFTFAQGDANAAAGSWQRAIEIDPDNVNAIANLGVADIHLGKLDDAREQLQKAVKIAPTAANYSTLANAMMLQGKYNDAIEMDQKAITLDTNVHDYWGNLASAYQWSGAHDKAAQAYDKAIALAEQQRAKTPDDSFLLVALGDYYASRTDVGRSLPLIRKALARSPEDPFIAYRAGEAYELLGQRDKAIPLIALALAHGYDATEFDRSPELASLRADVSFQVALAKAKTNRKIVVDTGRKVE